MKRLANCLLVAGVLGVPLPAEEAAPLPVRVAGQGVTEVLITNPMAGRASLAGVTVALKADPPLPGLVLVLVAQQEGEARKLGALKPGEPPLGLAAGDLSACRNAPLLALRLTPPAGAGLEGTLVLTFHSPGGAGVLPWSYARALVLTRSVPTRQGSPFSLAATGTQEARAAIPAPFGALPDLVRVRATLEGALGDVRADLWQVDAGGAVRLCGLPGGEGQDLPVTPALRTANLDLRMRAGRNVPTAGAGWLRLEAEAGGSTQVILCPVAFTALPEPSGSEALQLAFPADGKGPATCVFENPFQGRPPASLSLAVTGKLEDVSLELATAEAGKEGVKLADLVPGTPAALDPARLTPRLQLRATPKKLVTLPQVLDLAFTPVAGAPERRMVVYPGQTGAGADPDPAAGIAAPMGLRSSLLRGSLMLGTEYSNMYRTDPKDGFLSKSAGMLELDLDHRFKWGRPDYCMLALNVGLGGAFGPDTRKDDTGSTVAGIASATRAFRASLAFAPMWLRDRSRNPAALDAGGIAAGPIVGVTWASYPQTTSSEGQEDRIRSIPRAGLRLEWAYGASTHLDSYAELTCQKDSLFVQPWRFSALGRLTYRAPDSSFSFYLEGELNNGFGGARRDPGHITKDVGSLRAGMVLSLTSLFKAPASSKTPASGR
ncbi:hypothetical protein [Mesoterricola sediminis]|uniref:Uncharacterized protein n=1 Tax=Mesoterricola sediminis TaxID=2927980 RepID=A0AA48GXX1_9BACT|nr:hypothetical protein [Mesoterricola sediminis]BDU76425.1 hypothetical protein METESE_13830 [Mesoterricola sediminis]